MKFDAVNITLRTRKNPWVETFFFFFASFRGWNHCSTAEFTLHWNSRFTLRKLQRCVTLIGISRRAFKMLSLPLFNYMQNVVDTLQFVWQKLKILPLFLNNVCIAMGDRKLPRDTQKSLVLGTTLFAQQKWFQLNSLLILCNIFLFQVGSHRRKKMVNIVRLFHCMYTNNCT